MSHMGLIPKKTQLEQLKIEFDDATENDKESMPLIVNSKEKYKVGGPTNNY